MESDPTLPGDETTSLAAPSTVSPFEPLFMTLVEAEAETSAWQSLSDQAMEPNPFFRPEFLLPYLHYAEPAVVSIAAVRRRVGGQLVAFAPTGHRKLGLSRSAPLVWTNAYAPLGTPLLAPDCAEAAATKFLRMLMMQTGPLLALPEQRLDGTVAEAIRAGAQALGLKVAQTSSYQRPVLAVHGSMASYLSHFSSQRRRRYAKGYRRLKGQGHLVRDHLRGVHAAAVFEDFLALEQAGWKGEAGTAIASNPHLATFARKAVEQLAAAGCLMLDRLRLDDRTIAAVISFRDGPRAYAWKTAFDETQARNSPGLQVVLAAMENYFHHDALVEVDSLAGRAPSLIDDLWRERASFGTLVVAGGGLSSARLLSAKGDIVARDIARLGAKRLDSALRRFRKT
ncbi:acetyltransferase (GNAT) family protein [Breoghania corrubedonensis]|uniref:Acetyltransferase (GNAT) family protein n=1 Tax=Breoghania corrubedonensis TaxID=665038 RepID=A0A2T5VHX3_9HYPH|nr:GNAT family N-acetyltransferase [Breoghania corrubedonensis]PTW63369.1 acetyltransferase (GNAT) family protein [Breoghania corrubedonensis]